MGILDGVDQIGIEECGEDLVVLGNEFVLEPMYFKWGYADANEIMLRSGVVEKLIALHKGLEGKYRLKIWDGFRTLATQQILYDKYYEELKAKNPAWTDEELGSATEIFVSRASHNPLLPSPHNTGGAVDLTLVDSNGAELYMGTSFDEFNVKSYTDHFAESGGEAHENRMLLKSVMEQAGFVNYPEEWWHFSYGDQIWASGTGAKCAIYGSKELWKKLLR